MFAGHAALALASRKTTPELSLGVLVGASYGLDLIWPILLFTGVERVEIDPGNTAFTPLNFVSYPWSHSLLMTLVWALIAGGVVYLFSRSRRGAMIVSALVFSHWVLDVVTHRPDLPLWPGEGAPMAGLELWRSVAATLLVEGALFVGGAWLYIRATRAGDRIGSIGMAAFLILIGVIWGSGPFGPLPPNESAVAWVTLALWLLALWAWWFDRHSELRA